MAKLKERWLWLPDLAFDLSIWQDELMEVQNCAFHEFISYEKLAKNLNHLYHISGLEKANVIVASGLGALALLKNTSQKKENQKWILLSPFADFCSEEGNFTKESLHFMAKQMRITKEPGLHSFAELFEEEYGEWPLEWYCEAMKMDTESLIQGILYLADNQMTEVISDENIEVIYGRMDKAIPPPMTLNLKAFLPKANFKERPKAGHWPPLLLL